ncbi:MAG: hypothetical protein JNK55_10955 [Rubrivivax sp.]|nr:hypothetical protein [Rubrivivax sp.]
MKSLGLLIGLLTCGCVHAQVPPAPESPTGATPEGTLRRIDDRRPERPYRVLLGGVPLELTGSWEYSDEARRNFDLDDGRERHRRVWEHEVKLEARAGLREGLTGFVQAVALHETRRTQGTPGKRRTHEWQRGEMWVQWDRIGGTPWTLQVGRVPLLERRSLWWDDDLDAMRLRYAAGAWRLDTGLGRPLARVSSVEPGIAPAERGVWRQWGQLGWTWAQRQQVEAFWLIVADRSGTPAVGTHVAADIDPDTSDVRGRWQGLRASGEWRGAAGGLGPRLNYWADAVQLRGHETLTGFSSTGTGTQVADASQRRRLRSWALDAGATVVLGGALRPSLTLAYARGSGGEDSATRDANFRQTGLHENKARLAGVKRLRRYGELLQPDLSNLAITTLGTGIRWLGNSSLELVLHQFGQVVPATKVAGARLSTDPQGLQRRLGRELDLVVALREWSWLELTLRWSRFEPGPAFATNRRDAAHALELGAALNF